MKDCPKCGRPIVGHPAISRTDNKTEICSECGLNEAILAWQNNYAKQISYLQRRANHEREDD